MYLECNVGPIMRRGVKNAIWELEFLVKEQGAKLCKVYAPEDGPLNDREMWPFYEKACELDITLTIHMGMAYVCPQPTKYTLPSSSTRSASTSPSSRSSRTTWAGPTTRR